MFDFFLVSRIVSKILEMVLMLAKRFVFAENQESICLKNRGENGKKCVEKTKGGCFGLRSNLHA